MEKEEKKKSNGKWSENHPVARALIVTVVSILVFGLVENIIESIFGGIAVIVTGVETTEEYSNLGMVPTLITIAAFLLTLHLYWLIFRQKLQGFFGAGRTGAGLLLGWSVLAVDAFMLLMSILDHTTYGNIGKAIVMGLQPGISEEILFRIVPISLAMKTPNREKAVLPTLILTSLFFGAIHGANVLAGADPFTTIFQVLYTVGVGALFGVIYLRTGNMWITILLHSLTDIISLLGADLQSSGGVLTQKAGLVSVIYMLICAALYFFNAFLVFRKNRKEDVADIWARIWGRGQKPIA
jgi:uncharacterized protein